MFCWPVMILDKKCGCWRESAGIEFPIGLQVQTTHSGAFVVSGVGGLPYNKPLFPLLVVHACVGVGVERGPVG